MIQVYCDNESGVNKFLEEHKQYKVMDIKISGSAVHGEIIMVTYHIPDDSMVNITKEEYESLQEDAEKLSKLEAWGVDNWSGYGEALAQEYED